MSVSADRFYTWIDIESRLRALLEAGRWPDWLQSVSAYSAGVEISVSDASAGAAVAWLKEQFGLRIQESNDSVAFVLDGKGERSLQVVFEEVVGDHAAQLRFLFDPSSRVSRIKAGSSGPTSAEVSEIPLYAFHSFKGGVGRTTSALALALELSGYAGNGPGRRVLLVDADMEAPGISFLLEKRVPNLPISFADFLALANEGMGTEQEIALGTTADALKALDFGGLIVLPAFRAGESYESVSIRPEHLIRNSRDAFVISRLIRQLGKALNVDAIVVDLRAGISEVSAGLILDPTVNRVLVTTLGGQSTRGTRSILTKLTRSDALVASAFPGDFPVSDIALVVSQVTEEQRESVLPDEVDDMLSEVAEGSAPRVTVVEYVGDLALMSRSWDSCLTQISRSNIAIPLRSIADTVFAKDAFSDLTEASTLDAARSRLSDYSRRLEFAESGAGDSFLVTDSLHHLASDHLTELPLVTVVGQKGAGKSYTYLQLVRQGDWASFVGQTLSRTDAVRAPIFPLLEPLNLSEDARQLARSARTRVCDRLGTIPLGQAELRDFLREGLRSGSHEGDLRRTWVAAMARAIGLNENDDAKTILEALKDAGLERVVYVVDGLEDLLQDVHTDDAEQRSLRSLLNEVSSWLSQIPGRPIGLIVFARRDMVLASIKQNPGQFFHRYQPYELRWNREEALRLVAWVADQSGALEISIGERESEERLAEHLVPLWGLKLGSNDSREARTAEWVLAALSDFKGQVQARDVVRFLKVAATESIDDAHWQDRVLTPPGLRKAPVHCGREKIGEIGQETPRLKDVFSKLRTLSDEQRRVPFAASDLNLTLEEVELLERNGIVLREPDGYYMPEMYRQGLDFVVPRGARPRVLALARRAGVASARYD